MDELRIKVGVAYGLRQLRRALRSGSIHGVAEDCVSRAVDVLGVIEGELGADDMPELQAAWTAEEIMRQEG